MPSTAVTRSYAKALFELARERQQADAVADELARVVEVVRADDTLKTFMARPGIAPDAKRGVAREIARRLSLGQLVTDFVALVAAHGRGDQLEAIGDAYRGLADDAAGRVRARVRTAVALTDAERQTLTARLGAALGGRHVLVEEVVDTTLLGGFVAEIGSLVMDGSLDGQLARLREKLARG